MDSPTKEKTARSLRKGRNGRQAVSGKASRGSVERGEQRDVIPRYSMVIQWSDEDDAYVVTLPEFPECKTHGNTYEKAARNGQEVLELLIHSQNEEGLPLPEPQKFLPSKTPRGNQRRLLL